MKCPSCQAEDLDSSRFCKKCGQSLKTEVICQHCVHQNTLDSEFCVQCGNPITEQAPPKPRPKKPSTVEPTSFADGRYQVKKLLREGGKKKVYLAHDTLLDRDVAFARAGFEAQGYPEGLGIREKEQNKHIMRPD
jgi:hypothetical protein